MQQSPVEDTIANLNRLAQKPGVQATLVLSRQSGAIVQSTGLEKAETNGDSRPATSNADDSAEAKVARLQSVEETARLVFEYVTASSRIAQEMNGTNDDELKLLRVRTKRNELVIVPGKRSVHSGHTDHGQLTGCRCTLHCSCNSQHPTSVNIITESTLRSGATKLPMCL